MFVSPYFGGCKYTNNFLFINKKAVFQHFGVLITSAASDLLLLFLLLLFSFSFPRFSFLFPLSSYSYPFSPLPLTPSSFISLSFIFFHSAIFCHSLGSGRCPSSCSAIYHSSPYRHHTDHLHQTDTVLTGTIRTDTIQRNTIRTDRQSLG